MYDILLTASTYKSVDLAVNFLRTTKNFQANVLSVIVSPNVDELHRIHSVVNDVPYVLIHTDINCMHFGRAWGFAWAVANGVQAKYLCTCDDDLEWYDKAKDILPRLDQADREVGFSLMAFLSTHPRFPTAFDSMHDNMIVGVQWTDGNAIFSHWQDNLDYGVIDAMINTPQSYFVELEYCHRMRYMTHRPIIHDARKQYHYKHIFRAIPAINDIRASNLDEGMKAGNRLWKQKYGMDVNINYCTHEDIYNNMTAVGHADKVNNCAMFGGTWNEWDRHYRMYEDKTTVLYDTHL